MDHWKATWEPRRASFHCWNNFRIHLIILTSTDISIEYEMLRKRKENTPSHAHLKWAAARSRYRLQSPVQSGKAPFSQYWGKAFTFLSAFLWSPRSRPPFLASVSGFYRFLARALGFSFTSPNKPKIKKTVIISPLRVVPYMKGSGKRKLPTSCCAQLFPNLYSVPLFKELGVEGWEKDQIA